MPEVGGKSVLVYMSDHHNVSYWRCNLRKRRAGVSPMPEKNLAGHNLGGIPVSCQNGAHTWAYVIVCITSHICVLYLKKYI